MIECVEVRVGDSLRNRSQDPPEFVPVDSTPDPAPALRCGFVLRGEATCLVCGRTWIPGVDRPCCCTMEGWGASESRGGVIPETAMIGRRASAGEPGEETPPANRARVSDCAAVIESHRRIREPGRSGTTGDGTARDDLPSPYRR